MGTPQYNILNKTTDGTMINLAFYQKLGRRDEFPIVAWRTIAPKIGIPTYMPALSNYALFVKYKLNLVSYQTKPVAIKNYCGRYAVSRQKDKVSVEFVSSDLQYGLIQVRNNPEVAVSVEPCITLGANLVFPTRVIPPSVVMEYELNPSFFVALVPASVTMGAIMSHEDVAGTEQFIRPGQTIYVNGSAADGYSLSVENP